MDYILISSCCYFYLDCDKCTLNKETIVFVWQVYLADYGLSYRYSPNGEHKQYSENPKKGHNGTIEYTSIDAHKGVGKKLISFNIMYILSTFF